MHCVWLSSARKFSSKAVPLAASASPAPAMSTLLCAAARVARPRLAQCLVAASPAASSCTAVRAYSSARGLRADVPTSGSSSSNASASPLSSPASLTPDVPLDPNTSPVGLTGGAPEEFVRRTCRIYRPSRSATQQGPEYRWSDKEDRQRTRERGRADSTANERTSITSPSSR